VASKEFKVSPMAEMQFFDSGNLETMKNKILELNGERKLMTANQLINLDFIVKVVKDVGGYHSSKIYKADLELLDAMIRWPIDCLPAALGLY